MFLKSEHLCDKKRIQKYQINYNFFNYLVLKKCMKNSSKLINYYCTFYNQQFKFYLYSNFQNRLNISIPVLITIHRFVTKLCQHVCSRSSFGLNLRNVTKAPHVPECGMCSVSCHDIFQGGEGIFWEGENLESALPGLSKILNPGIVKT